MLRNFMRGGTTEEMNKFKFGGKEEDFETGLANFGRRQYDMFTGRWTTVDPLKEKYPFSSPYVYVLGNPTTFIDPFGLDVWYYDDKGKLETWVEDPNVDDVFVNGNRVGGFSDFVKYKEGETLSDQGLVNTLLGFGIYLRNVAGVEGAVINVRGGDRPNDDGSPHQLGLAADIKVEGMSSLGVTNAADKSGLFNGIGYYPDYGQELNYGDYGVNGNYGLYRDGAASGPHAHVDIKDRYWRGTYVGWHYEKNVKGELELRPYFKKGILQWELKK